MGLQRRAEFRKVSKEHFRFEIEIRNSMSKVMEARMIVTLQSDNGRDTHLEQSCVLKSTET